MLVLFLSYVCKKKKKPLRRSAALFPYQTTFKYFQPAGVCCCSPSLYQRFPLGRLNI
uniref:Uncharacterized protein n=1 Tax=Anguilla anguilla TaxID=7936 RepID=A0A0E9TTR8_ANGAN